MKKCVLVFGTFDSKGREFAFMINEIKRRDVEVMTMDVGVFAPVGDFLIDIPAESVAEKGGKSLESLRAQADRGAAMKVMCSGAREIVTQLCKSGRINGVISMGGGGGTSIAATAMQALPIGFPKVCITTLASGETSEYVGTKDVVLFPAIVDICGINHFSRVIISRAVGAVCGMMELEPPSDTNDKPTVFLSMFGNSTEGVEKCAERLRSTGCEPMIFHATGGGGRTMEELIKGGYCVGVLDITTTEWADELCGGILSAGPERLDGPAIAGVPHLIVPGCLDMVNFGSFSTVPQHYKDAGRRFYEWNPMVTLMRTTVDENRKLGKILAEKANTTKYPVAFLLPTRGLSILDGDGQCFCDRAADEALFCSIKEHLRPDIPVYTVDANINDDAFADKAVKIMLGLMNMA